MINQRKILIVGGSGFIGTKLTEALLENGHSVVLQSPVALFMCLQGRQWQQTA